LFEKIRIQENIANKMPIRFVRFI